jgi:hypothetical protein
VLFYALKCDERTFEISWAVILALSIFSGSWNVSTGTLSL